MPLNEISVATAEDLPRLVELLGILLSQEAEFTPDPAVQERGLLRILDDPRIGQILVLSEGATIVAMASLLFSVSTALGESVAILEDMIVDPNFRGRGAGSRLLGAAIEHAKNVGCHRITLLTDHANEDAQRFYRRHGFVISDMVPMRLLMTPNE